VLETAKRAGIYPPDYVFHKVTVIGLTRSLISAPSHTAEGEEQATDVLEEFLQQAGMKATRQRVEDVGVNVIAALPSEGEEVGLLYNGHLHLGQYE
jgi:acetylornithine deacetylase/succinyl-diaminopimelate desuccinylase-like protein